MCYYFKEFFDIQLFMTNEVNRACREFYDVVGYILCTTPLVTNG